MCNQLLVTLALSCFLLFSLAEDSATESEDAGGGDVALLQSKITIDARGSSRTSQAQEPDGTLDISGEGDDSRPSSAQAPNGTVDINVWYKVSIVEATGDTLATCNDSTSVASYYSPAPRRGKKHQWFVYLEGGGWCWDAASCATRHGHLVSSANYTELLFPGKYRTDSPMLELNRILIRYCSSDGWLGDIGPPEGAPVNWRGARIVRAALRHIVAKYHITDRDLVLFGGASAGARGAMAHLDRLKMDGLVPTGVRLLGVLDSPYYVDMPPFENMTDIQHRVTLQSEMVVANMKNEAFLRGPGLCNLTKAWQCSFGEYRMPLLTTPYILYTSQYDWYGLKTAEGAMVTNTSCFPNPQCPYYEYANDFARRVHRGVTQLPPVLAGTSALFSSRCYDHADTARAGFTEQQVLGVTMAEALTTSMKAILHNRRVSMPVIVDTTCHHLNCGCGCLKKLDPACKGGGDCKAFSA